MNKVLIKKIKLLSIVILIAIVLLIVIRIITYKSPIERKFQGFWNIEMENSFWERICKYDIGTVIFVEPYNKIKLPIVYNDTIGSIDFKGKTALELGDDFFTDEIMEKGRKHFERIEQDAIGTWEIISTNPDSIFLNVPKNPLHGKYAIRFFIDKNGYWGRSLIYKIELQNDSTYLICNNGKTIMSQKEGRNWEGEN